MGNYLIQWARVADCIIRISFFPFYLSLKCICAITVANWLIVRNDILIRYVYFSKVSLPSIPYLGRGGSLLWVYFGSVHYLEHCMLYRFFPLGHHFWGNCISVPSQSSCLKWQHLSDGAFYESLLCLIFCTLDFLWFIISFFFFLFSIGSCEEFRFAKFLPTWWQTHGITVHFCFCVCLTDQNSFYLFAIENHFQLLV